MKGAIGSTVEVAVEWNVLVILRAVISGRGTLILRRGIPLVNGQNPLRPTLLRTETVHTILANQVVDVAKAASNMTEHLKVLRQRLDTLEAGDDSQWYKALRVHVTTQEHVLAHVVNREVVLKLHGQHIHEAEGLHVLLVRNRAHRAGSHIRVGGIHRVDLCREWVDIAVHAWSGQ